MFSVDGGHSTDVALHDLRLANEVLVDGGIIMLDDYFDPSHDQNKRALSALPIIETLRFQSVCHGGLEDFFADMQVVS